MDAVNDSFGIIVLAAGASVRMHEPKQLLNFDGKTLLRRAAETAVKTVYEPVVVVLGANVERTRAEIEDLQVHIAVNEKWREGLSSSIKKGIEELLTIEPEMAAVLISLADQPHVTAVHLNKFKEQFHCSDSLIIAAAYDETTGVPALFSRRVFEDFHQLSGDQGAKPIFRKHRASLSTIDLPEAAFDIDTPDDFLKLNRRLRNKFDTGS